jgi:hypothetical protein
LYKSQRRRPDAFHKVTSYKELGVIQVWQRALYIPVIVLLLFVGMYLSLAAFAPTTHAQEIHAEASGTIITYGETVQGQVKNRFGDEWLFFGWAGERVTITLSSSEFDPTLELYGPKYRRWYKRNNDSEGMGQNSALNSYKLPYSGYYTIVAAPSSNDATGSYTLTLEGLAITPF